MNRLFTDTTTRKRINGEMFTVHNYGNNEQRTLYVYRSNNDAESDKSIGHVFIVDNKYVTAYKAIVPGDQFVAVGNICISNSDTNTNEWPSTTMEAREIALKWIASPRGPVNSAIIVEV